MIAQKQLADQTTNGKLPELGYENVEIVGGHLCVKNLNEDIVFLNRI